MFLYGLERLGFFLFFHKRKEEETLNFFYQNHGLSPLIWKNDNFVIFLFLAKSLTNPFSINVIF